MKTMAMMDASEKRFGERKPFHQRVIVEASDMTHLMKNIQKEAEVRDIASGGIGLLMDHDFMKGQVVRLSIPLSCTEVSLPVYAEVMWSMRTSGQATRIGLRFLE